tara:strand:- start:1522 stop:2820 length:1299 start_codon:yes stop_codon:yes gene_type:complete
MSNEWKLSESYSYGELEFYNRKDYLCRAPFTGFVIDPVGNLTLCCMANSSSFSYGGGKIYNIEQVESLKEFYNSDEMEYYRRELENKNGDKIDPCRKCFRSEASGLTGGFKYQVNNRGYSKALEGTFDDDWDLREQNIDRDIRWIELTTSNICNATCSTCSSFFSSKWIELDKLFREKKIPGHHSASISRLSDKSLKKIMDILPGLRILELKGGEPFADLNNTKILEELNRVNKSCKVIICSNFYKITPKTMKVLKNLNNMNQLKNLGASIDGVDKEYDWIRSNDFKTTCKTLENFYNETGKTLTINTCVSFWNFFSLDKIVDYFKDKPYVRAISFNNVIGKTQIHSHLHIPLEIRKKQFRYYDRKWRKERLVHYEHLRSHFTKDQKGVFNSRSKKRLFKHMETIDEFRGFKLTDYCPEIKEIYDEYRNRDI